MHISRPVTRRNNEEGRVQAMDKGRNNRRYVRKTDKQTNKQNQKKKKKKSLDNTCLLETHLQMVVDVVRISVDQVHFRHVEQLTLPLIAESKRMTPTEWRVATYNGTVPEATFILDRKCPAWSRSIISTTAKIAGPWTASRKR